MLPWKDNFPIEEEVDKSKLTPYFWIGILFFFNFINIQLQGALDDAGKKAVNPKRLEARGQIYVNNQGLSQ